MSLHKQWIFFAEATETTMLVIFFVNSYTFFIFCHVFWWKHKHFASENLFPFPRTLFASKLTKIAIFHGFSITFVQFSFNFVCYCVSVWVCMLFIYFICNRMVTIHHCVQPNVYLLAIWKIKRTTKKISFEITNKNNTTKCKIHYVLLRIEMEKVNRKWKTHSFPLHAHTKLYSKKRKKNRIRMRRTHTENNFWCIAVCAHFHSFIRQYYRNYLSLQKQDIYNPIGYRDIYVSIYVFLCFGPNFRRKMHSAWLKCTVSERFVQIRWSLID